MPLGLPEWAIGIMAIILMASITSVGVRLLTGGRPRRGLLRLYQPEIPEDLQARLGELDEMKQRIGELEERVDFAERVLAQQREGQRLPPPS